ncbi:unnamed protein product, partial [Rotaria magnacalcarata]
MKTNDIMRNLIVHGKQIFGYVDRGVSTQNLTGKKMKEAVDVDRCARYQKQLHVKKACLETMTVDDQFTQAWFGT